MKKILMVCLGNICRSPMAEGIMQSKIDKYKIDAFVDSCGTAAYHVGEMPDRRAVSTLKAYDIDISHLRGRQFVVDDFDNFDHIYVMDEQNYSNVMRKSRHQKDRDKVSMIMNELYKNGNIDVSDPYYGGINGFESTYEMLDQATEIIAQKLSKE